MWYGEIFGPINLTLGGKAKTNKKLAQYKNYVEFQNVFARLVKKALARYSFEGLPDTVNERVLKMSLLFHGSVCFFEKEGNLLALPAMPNSNLTLYGDFKSCFVYGRNGYHAEIPLYIHGGADSKIVDKGYMTLPSNTPSGVWVRENEMVYPFLNYCVAYAEKIADTQRTLDVTRSNMKRPYIVVAEEQVVPSIKKFMEDKNDNVDYVVSSGVFDVNKVNVIPFQSTPENLKACTDLVEWYMNDFDALCGLNSNANSDKKERLIVDEVNANNESIEQSVDSVVEYMQSQLDDVNKYFGTNITIGVTNKEDDEDDDVFGMDSDSGSESMAAGRSDSE